MGCIASKEDETIKFQMVCEKNNIQYKGFKNQILFLKQRGYIIEQIIGANFGDVTIEAKDKDHKNVAIKIINYENIKALNDDAQSNNNKGNQKISKYIVQTYENLINKPLKTIFQVREFCDCSLRDFIKANVFSERQVYAITKQLLEGLIEIRQKMAEPINSNIKPENILYSRKKNAFLFGDFNIPIEVKSQNEFQSQKITYTTVKQNTNNLYYSPEISSDKPNLTWKNDIFSLGQTLAEIVRGKKFLSYQQQDFRAHDSLQRYLPKNSPFEKYINLILMNMVKVNINERLEPQELINKLNQHFQVQDQDLVSLKEIPIPKLAFQVQEPKQKIVEVVVTKDNYKKLSRADQNININLSMSNINDEFLENVSKQLQQCNQVQKLYINGFANYDLTDKGLTSLVEVITQFTQLQKLKLEFHSCEKIKGISVLALAIKNFKNLENLSLKFDECSGLYVDTLLQLSDGLKQCTSIQKLSLSFSQCYNLQSEGLSKLSEGLKLCTGLKGVFLNFHKCYKIKDTGFISLVNALKNLNNLTKLFLIFSSTSIGNEGISGLQELFKQLKNLQRLELNIKETNITDDEIILKLYEGMQSCIDLEELKLNFEKLPFQNSHQISQQIDGYFQKNKFMQYELNI